MQAENANGMVFRAEQEKARIRNKGQAVSKMLSCPVSVVCVQWPLVLAPGNGVLEEPERARPDCVMRIPKAESNAVNKPVHAAAIITFCLYSQCIRFLSSQLNSLPRIAQLPGGDAKKTHPVHQVHQVSTPPPRRFWVLGWCWGKTPSGA